MTAWRSSLIFGTQTNDNAASGIVGEIITATVVSGSAVALTTTVTANVTSISLTTGDWDITAQVDFLIGATTSLTQLNSSISLTTGTLSPQTGGSGLGTDATATANWAAMIPAGNIFQNAGPVRLSISATTTVFLVAQSTFTISTNAAYGTIRARRMR